ncbi:MAG: MBL fold metallo-hydrolase [Acidimicrobiales bacterium]|nr:MBL fold metallo-hydrolase [Acidimicrobiales bacterium]
MQVTATGHAGLAVRSGDAMVLVDPWFSPFGAFDASWFVFPDNLAVLDTLDVPDAVVITHEHLDHLDAWYLAQLPAEVPVVIPSYPSPILRRKVAAAGRTVIVELADRERREVAPGIGVRFVREESPMNHDAAVVLDTPDGNVVDLNDARIFPVQLREIRAELGGTIDVLALQGSGASWYPLVYDYPAERIEALCREKRATKFSYVVRAVEVAEPRVVVPFAGPPCFLDPELAWVNEQMTSGIFPDQRQVADHLAAAGHDHAVVLLPGESLRMPDGALTRLECWQGFWERDRSAYLADYAERRRDEVAAVLDAHPDPDIDLFDAFVEHGMQLLGCNAYCNERIDMRVGFDVTGPGGGAWHIDFRPGREGVGRGLDDCGYVYTFASRWLPPILAGEVPWEDFFLSLRFRARRDPDLYNDHLLGVLKFADANALAAVEAYERSIDRSARITVAAPDGRRWSVSRWCPHAGTDLRETGEVLVGAGPDGGDVLVCLAHHYRFDLGSGACSNGRCAPLEVTPLTGPAG